MRRGTVVVVVVVVLVDVAVVDVAGVVAGVVAVVAVVTGDELVVVAEPLAGEQAARQAHRQPAALIAVNEIARPWAWSCRLRRPGVRDEHPFAMMGA